MKRVAHHSLRVSLWLLIAAVMLIALFTAMARVGLPLVSMYKTSIEQLISQTIGSTVSIGEVRLRWRALGPQLYATELLIAEADVPEVRVRELLVDVNLAASLASLQPVINELTFVGADLVVQHQQGARYQVRGMGEVGMQGSAPAVAGGLDVMGWLINANRVGLLDTTVTLIDARGRHSSRIRNLSIRTENLGNRHRLRLELALPQEQGGLIEVGLDLSGAPTRPARTDGDFYIRADAVASTTVRQLTSVLGVRLPDHELAGVLDATLDTELWGRWKQGVVTGVRGTLSLDEVRIDNGRPLLNRVHSRVAYTAASNENILAFAPVTLEQGSLSTRIEALVLRMEHSPAAPVRVQAYGEQFPLGLLNGSTIGQSSAAKKWPGQWLGRWLQARAQGTVRDWRFEMVTPEAGSGAPPDITLQAQITDLSWQAVGELPGVHGLQARIDVEENVGVLELQADTLQLSSPVRFDNPISLQGLSSTLEIDARARPLINGHVNSDDPALRSRTRVRLQWPEEGAPHIDLQSRFESDDVSVAVARLPAGVLPKAAQRWMSQAIQGGQVRQGSLVLFGELGEFPFTEGDGVFELDMQIAEGQLQFLPQWPALTELHGTLGMRGPSISAQADTGRMQSMVLSGGTVSIADLRSPVLEARSSGHDQLTNMIRFARNGPLAHVLGPVFSGVGGSGSAQMDLRVEVPLSARARDARQSLRLSGGTTRGPGLRIDGRVFLQDNELRLDAANLSLGDVRGAVGFDETGVKFDAVQARLQGQLLHLQGHTQDDGADRVTRVQIKGAVDAGKLLAHFDLPIAPWVAGSALWDVQLSAPHDPERIAREGVSMRASSDLVGTALVLPAPLDKGSAAPWPMTLSTRFPVSASLQPPGQQPSQQWRWQIPGQWQGRVVLDGERQMHSLAMHLGEERARYGSSEGIQISGSVRRLDAWGWSRRLAALIERLPPADPPAPILPVSLDVDTPELAMGPHALGPARIRASTDDTYLNVLVDNAALTGSVRYPRAHWQRERVAKAHLQHVDKRLIDALEAAAEADERAVASGEEATSETPFDPRLLPGIDTRIDNLVWQRLHLRDVSLRAVASVTGLDIETLGYAHGATQLIGSGYWQVLDAQELNPALQGQQATQLDLIWQSGDIGLGLEHIGLDGVTRDGQGRVTSTLSWPGPLYAPSLDDLNGQVDIELQRGRVLGIEPGAGRLVGLFALQALPRRLNLDFRDITDDGLDYRQINGRITLEQGVARTDLVQLDGPIGVIEVTGASNLVTRQFDQRITVLPRVSAALPIIGMISGGASAGVGALLAGGLLKALGIDFDRLGLREYQLQGPWETPALTPVGRTSER